MAGRYLERREQLSLDRILCDPELAAVFDVTAASLAPGFSSLQHRWAALNLRKARRFKPELLSRVAPPREIIHCRARELVVSQLPVTQGLYLLFDGKSLAVARWCARAGIIAAMPCQEGGGDQPQVIGDSSLGGGISLGPSGRPRNTSWSAHQLLGAQLILQRPVEQPVPAGAHQS